MGLGHHETKRDIAMHHFIHSESDINTESEAEDFMIASKINLYEQENDSNNSENSKQYKGRGSSTSLKSVASRISTYVAVVKDTVSEASKKIPGFAEADIKDYQCCE